MGFVGNYAPCGLSPQTDGMPVIREVRQKKLPAIKALSTVHIGAYEHLKYAYKALFDYAASHNLRLLTPSREIYIQGPGMLFRGNPDNYKTEILMPFSTTKSEGKE